MKFKAHIALNVRNVDESVDFYRRLFAREPLKQRPGYAKFDVSDPPLNLSLNEQQSVRPGALSHLGIQVGSTDEVLAMMQRWQSSGLVTRDEMQTNCCFALQDKTWVEDPDGNLWEAFVVLQDNIDQSTLCCGGDRHGNLVSIEL